MAAANMALNTFGTVAMAASGYYLFQTMVKLELQSHPNTIVPS